jgi:uncharacterized repeat protein (TIGR03806 family)
LRWTGISAAALALVALSRSLALAQPFGIAERAPNLDLRINSLPGGDDHPVPEKLSDLPALLLAASGRGHEVGGVIPYEPSAKLWSDGASKERYIALPDYAFAAPSFAQVTFRSAGGWDFPDESVIVKNFLLPLDLRDPAGSAKRIETRVLYKTHGSWNGFNYEWNDEETDAVLLPSARTPRDFTVIDAAGEPFMQTWVYPSRDDCFQCHNAAANRVLGPNTPQMNQTIAYPSSGVSDNQLRTLEHVGFFDAPLPAPPANLPRMPDATDPGAGLDARARAYLAANCGICHRPGAPIDADMNLTWESRREEMNAIDAPANRGTAGLPPNARLIYAGRPDLSVVIARMSTLDPVYRMPRIGSHRVDDDGVALLRDWISTLEIPAPQDLAATPGAGRVSLAWSPVFAEAVSLDGYNVYRSTTRGELGEKLNGAPVAGASYEDAELQPGTYYYAVKAEGEGREGAPSNQVQVVVTRAAVRFLRGNCNTNGNLDLSDAVFSLGFLFVGGTRSSCEESCDSNSDGRHDVSDPIYTLSFLFSGGPPPGSFPACETAEGECGGACPGAP